ncbi:MAG: hypothetical protein CK425_07285 [Parachlamydia sp.]|nr:MAG: hypothetical protein CK425_07285 [Parachlamydia sp.]
MNESANITTPRQFSPAPYPSFYAPSLPLGLPSNRREPYASPATSRIQNISSCQIPGCQCRNPAYNSTPSFYQNATFTPSIPSAKTTQVVNRSLKERQTPQFYAPPTFSLFDPNPNLNWGSPADRNILRQASELVRIASEQSRQKRVAAEFAAANEIKHLPKQAATVDVDSGERNAFLQLEKQPVTASQSKNAKGAETRSPDSHPKAVAKIKKSKKARPTFQMQTRSKTRDIAVENDAKVLMSVMESTSSKKSPPDFLYNDDIIESGFVKMSSKERNK